MKTKTLHFALSLLLLSSAISSSAQIITTRSGSSYTGSSGVACIGSFTNTSNINSSAFSDWVDFQLDAGLGCTFWIHSSLQSNATSGSYAGFHIKANSALSLIGGMQIQTYLSGVWQETAVGGNIIPLMIGTEGDIYFATTKPYNELRLVFTGLLSLAYDVDIFYGFASTSLPNGSTLSVGVSEFEAKRIGTDVEIQGRVTSEESVRNVTLEKSANGREFTSVTTVEGTKDGKYKFSDKSIYAAYYRMKITTNSKNYYSQIVKIASSDKGLQMKLAVQSSQPKLTLTSTVKQVVDVSVHDASGRLLFSTKQTVNEEVQINLPNNLATGSIYIITATTVEGKRLTQKIAV